MCQGRIMRFAWLTSGKGSVAENKAKGARGWGNVDLLPHVALVLSESCFWRVVREED
jgi:hypothetical protein